MAKKKSENNTFSFNSLIDELKEFNADACIIEDSSVANIDEWIDTGNYLLNAQICGDIYGGIPQGRVTVLAGESGCLHPKQKIKVYISKNEHKKNVEILLND